MQTLLRRSRSLLVMLVIMLTISPLSVLAEGENTNTINYVALGDSLAVGVLSDNSLGSGYVGMIKGDLETNGYVVNVHKKGVPGATTGSVLAGLPGIAELADADMITVSAGANDILAGLKPILDSGINLADLNPEKLVELQQEAAMAAGAAGSAKVGATTAISEAKLSVYEGQNAVAKVEEAVTLAAAEIYLISQYLTPEQLAKITPAIGLIQEAKDSVNKAGENIDTAGVEFEKNGQEVINNLSAATSHLGFVEQKLSSVVDIIGMIESLNIPMPISNIRTVKVKANEAIAAANSSKSKVEAAKQAVNTYAEAMAKAETAQIKAKTAAEAAAKLAEIPGIIQGVGVKTGQILAAIRTVNPNAKIYVMGYYNALPYLSAEVQETMTKPMLNGLNAAISAPTAQFNATFVPVAHLFEGNYQTYLPNPTNIHPSEAGYRALANGFMAKISEAFPVIIDPEPSEQNIDVGTEVTVNPGQLININKTNVTLLLPDDLPEGTLLTVTATNEDALSKAKAGDLEAFGDALNFEFKYPEWSKDYQGTFTLVMGYKADSPENVAIYHFNEASGKWEIQKGENNKDSKSISLEVTDFSNYGVFAQVDKPDPTEPTDPTDPTDPKDDDGATPPGTKDPSKGSKDTNKKHTKKDTKKNKLPNTATSHYNWLLLGATLLLTGVVMFVISRKRRLQMKG